jgi:tight adherence protein C
MIRATTAAEDAQPQIDGPAPFDWRPDRLLDRLESQPTEDLAVAAPAIADSALAHVTDCFAQAMPETRSRTRDIRANLRRAGRYEPRAYQKLAAIRYLGMLLSLVVFGTLAIFASPRIEPWCVLGVALGMLASWSFPVWRLRRRAARRIDEIERGMPDLLDLVNVCLGQGVSVESSLEIASRELRSVHPAVADELAIVRRQAELTSRETALDEFEQRIDLPEIRSLVSRLLQVDSAQAR